MVKEEHKLRVFENRMLRRIFGLKRDGVMGGWRKLHSEELHNLYSLPNIIRIIKSRKMRWAGHVYCCNRALVTGRTCSTINLLYLQLININFRSCIAVYIDDFNL
jgi:hypothetical protein